MEKHEKYKEILILMCLLTKKGIKFEVEGHLDGYRLGYPVLHWRKCEVSVIEHGLSCGSAMDKLEVMTKNGKILTYRTASQVLGLIEELEKKKE
jgi:hypothetical protein